MLAMTLIASRVASSVPIYPETCRGKGACSSASGSRIVCCAGFTYPNKFVHIECHTNGLFVFVARLEGVPRLVHSRIDVEPGGKDSSGIVEQIPVRRVLQQPLVRTPPVRASCGERSH